MKNQYGKSAVDATRRNTLPLYLDQLFKGGVSSTSVFEVVLPADEWVLENNVYCQYVEVKHTEGDVIIVSPAEGYQIKSAKYNILGEYNDTLGGLVFQASEEPIEAITMMISLYGGTVEESLPLADNIKF